MWGHDSMKLTLHRLLEYGYFPSELPPPFQTGSFARFVSRSMRSRFPFNLDAVRSSRPEIYHHARRGSLRRPLAIINPIHFGGLADFIVRNWDALKLAACKSPFSLTSPEIGRSGRAIGRKFPFEVLAERRAGVRSRGKILVKADISRFYHSIYTHSVPWALHGRRWSKKNRRVSCLGNDLDKLLQGCQDGQTNGIPIGPDTSLLIAEIILSKVDSTIADKLGPGLRYMDDYELLFDTEGQAMRGLSELQHGLLQFELHLNSFKTTVVQLPEPLEERWTAELRGASLDPNSKQFRAQVIRYFDSAFTLTKQFPTTGVLKYAIGRIANLKINHDFDLVEDLLLQVARTEAGTVPVVLEIILSRRKLQSRKQKRAELLVKTILEQAPQRHSSEVAWSIWGCIAIGISIPSEAVTAILQMEDSVCTLLLLHAQEVGLARAKSASRILEAVMTTDELYDSRWLLAYEANVKCWINGPKGDHVSRDPNFGKLKAAGVSFYDLSKTFFPPRPFKKRKQAQKEPVTTPPEYSDMFQGFYDYTDYV
jgi:hypothetical protein